jgi:hypothetical protein
MIQTFIFFTLVLFASLSYGANNNNLLPQLDDDFKKVTTQAYRELAAAAIYKLPQVDLPALIEKIEQADEKNDGGPAVNLIVVSLVVANMATIQKNINAKEIQQVTALTLKYHAVGVAEQILELANSQGDTYAQAKQHFEFAKYEADVNHWDKAIAWLRKIDIANALSKDNGDEASIIVGAALQYRKKHREAITYYANVKQDSPFYSIAQLNTALAYIRQDWWTDAQLTIEQGLAKANKSDIEITSRLYTILGFSQLQQGFYRNARESFRNVKIKSIYANRALLGVGMAALNQEDFVGAINAFSQLKTRTENDMAVAQSYLLNAYALTKIKQNAEASASYTEAISYYEQKTHFYDSLLNDIKNTTPASLPTLMNKISLVIEKQEPELSLLESKLMTLGKLSGGSFSTTTLSPNTLLQINTLHANILSVYLRKATDVMTKNQIAFNDYLNQSRFGLTKLYDSNN